MVNRVRCSVGVCGVFLTAVCGLSYSESSCAMPSISLSGAPTSATQLDMDSIDPAALSLRPSQQQQIFHPHQHASTSPSPTPSMPPAAAASSSVASAAVDPSLPPKPDRAKHDAIKARYRVLQNKWHDLTAVSRSSCTGS